MYKRSLDNGTCSSTSTSTPFIVSVASPIPPTSAKPNLFMPDRHFSNVHSHYYSTGPVHDASNISEVSEVMQPYNFRRIDTRRSTGFNTHRNCPGARRPPRKKIDLENLPPLSSRLAEEIEHQKTVMEQAALFAKIREKQEEETERKRRTSTAQEHPMSPFVLCTDKWYPAVKAGTVMLTPEITPPASLQLTNQTSIDQSKPSEDLAIPRAPHVRWAPNLIQQKQKQLQPLQTQQHSQLRPKPQRRRSSDRRPSHLKKVTLPTKA